MASRVIIFASQAAAGYMGGTLHLHQATSSYLILPQSIRGEACEFTSSSALASVSVALASPCIDMENCMSEPLSLRM